MDSSEGMLVGYIGGGGVGCGVGVSWFLMGWRLWCAGLGFDVGVGVYRMDEVGEVCWR